MQQRRSQLENRMAIASEDSIGQRGGNLSRRPWISRTSSSAQTVPSAAAPVPLAVLSTDKLLVVNMCVLHIFRLFKAFKFPAKIFVRV